MSPADAEELTPARQFLAINEVGSPVSSVFNQWHPMEKIFIFHGISA
jgi:hypothetical protein